MPRSDDNRAKTVLVIEDDVLFRSSLCELLGGLGVDVQPVGDAEEAVRALRRQAFDAVITDLDIPGNGSTVLRYAKVLRPKTPVIILTGLPPSKHPGGRAFRRLYKPASVREIRDALCDAFNEDATAGIGS